MPHAPHPHGPSHARLLALAINDAKSSLGVLMSQIDALAGPSADAVDAACGARYELQRVNHNLAALLNLHQFQQGNALLNIDLHGVRDLIEEVAASHRAQLQARAIELSVECDEALCGLFDYNLVAGVLSNALNNAIRYTHDRLRVSARREHESAPLTIAVEDNGEGFPAPMLALAALPPERCDASMLGGAGLGQLFAAVAAAAHRKGDRAGYTTLDNDSMLGGGRFALHLH